MWEKIDLDNFFTFVDWFRRTAPYIHAHRGRVFVLQIDGEVIGSERFSSLIHDLALLNSFGIKLVVVFGASYKIDKLLKERKIKSNYVGHLRVTDKDTIVSVKQAVGEVKFQIEALLSMGLPNSPMASSSIKVASGNYITGRPYGIVDGIDLGLTGKVRKIDKQTIQERLNAGEIVLIPPLGYSLTGQLFNINSAEIAAQMAIELKADKLIMLNNGYVVKDAADHIIEQLTCIEAKKILNSKSANNNKQLITLELGIKACESSVERVHYIDIQIDGGVLHELFSRDGVGTLLSNEPFDDLRQATVSDIGGILELIQPLEEEGVLVKRSREKIEVAIDKYIVITRDSTVIACAALHNYPADKVIELACLAVHSDYRKQGKADALFKYIEKTAKIKKANILMVLTTQTEHWFIEKGFVETDISSLPIQRQDIYNYQRNSKALIKKII